jgi:peptide/nickel transport system substrate-binding protein
MFASAQRGGALDYASFHSPALDVALVRARDADRPDAARAWANVESLLADSMPAAWLYHARGVQGKSRKLQHVIMDLRGELTSIAKWTRRDSL